MKLKKFMDPSNSPLQHAPLLPPLTPPPPPAPPHPPPEPPAAPTPNFSKNFLHSPNTPTHHPTSSSHPPIPPIHKHLSLTPLPSQTNQNASHTRYFNPFHDPRKSSSFITPGSSSNISPQRPTLFPSHTFDRFSLPTSFSHTPSSLSGPPPPPSSSPAHSTATSPYHLSCRNSNLESSALLPFLNQSSTSSAPCNYPSSAPSPDLTLHNAVNTPTTAAASEHLYRFPLFVDEKESDDELHMPHPDDDKFTRTSFLQRLTWRNFFFALALIIILSTIIFLFIVLPILTHLGILNFSSYLETPLHLMSSYRNYLASKPEPWAYVNNRKYPLLKNLRHSLIDPDTPPSAYKRKSVSGQVMQLVFSDEFNRNNRSFYPGDDPYWYAPDLWYGATADIEWYDPDAVTTYNGDLYLRMDKFRTHNLDFRSAMLHSWNQLCFQGGYLEVSLSFPGPYGVRGYWPGVWTMGNLARPGYLATTDGLWPYTYSSCDHGITPNQSMTDGTSFLPGQRLNSCTCPGEDHPSPGSGRGAPEIDILEARADHDGLSTATQSYQVAPFDIWRQPDYNYLASPYPNISYLNTFTGTAYQQAVSTTSTLNPRWFDGVAYQKFGYEYTPGLLDRGKIVWYTGNRPVFFMDGRAVRSNGNVNNRLVTHEPMSIILNLGISHSWVDIDWSQLRFPALLRIDYVRLYQLPGKRSVTCDPVGYETTQYISRHPKAYNNPNVTSWTSAGYKWPRNKFMHGCPSKSRSRPPPRV